MRGRIRLSNNSDDVVYYKEHKVKAARFCFDHKYVFICIQNRCVVQNLYIALLCSLEVQHMFIIVVVKDLLLPPEAALRALLSLDLPGLPGVPPDLRGQVRL